MDELHKTEVRNYLTAAGLLLLGITALLGWLENAQSASDLIMPSQISGLILMTSGILLLVLQKRDLAGLTFIIFGASYFLPIFTAADIKSTGIPYIASLITLMWGLILLTSKDRQKWIFAAISIIFGLPALLSIIIGQNAAVYDISNILLALASLYFALAAGFERISLPSKELINADGTTDFKKSGSSIGYLIFGGLALCDVMIYLNVPVISSHSSAVQGAALGFGSILIIIGILLLAIAKMRFTPVMFILLGASEMILGFSSGAMVYVLGLLVLITGLFAMSRKESRGLAGLMLICYAATYFISAAVTGNALFPYASYILNMIPALIAIYLAIAVLSQRDLPLI